MTSEQQRQHLSALVDGEVAPALVHTTVSAFASNGRLKSGLGELSSDRRRLEVGAGALRISPDSGPRKRAHCRGADSPAEAGGVPESGLSYRTPGRRRIDRCRCRCRYRCRAPDLPSRARRRAYPEPLCRFIHTGTIPAPVPPSVGMSMNQPWGEQAGPVSGASPRAIAGIPI